MTRKWALRPETDIVFAALTLAVVAALCVTTLLLAAKNARVAPDTAPCGPSGAQTPKSGRRPLSGFFRGLTRPKRGARRAVPGPPAG